MEMIDSQKIQFEEKHVSDDGMTTLFFTAPKDFLNGQYPEAESSEIRVEFPTNNPEPTCASVAFSPTKDGEDYDWNDVDFSNDEFERLLALSE